MEYKDFVLRIDDLLKKRGLKRQTLAEECGFTVPNFAKWKHGTSKPIAESVLAIAQYFNVSMEWLLTGKDSKDLNDDERNLVYMYRSVDDRGKANILATAQREHELTAAETKKHLG